MPKKLLFAVCSHISGFYFFTNVIHSIYFCAEVCEGREATYGNEKPARNTNMMHSSEP
jgi:hypothetical protein